MCDVSASRSNSGALRPEPLEEEDNGFDAPIKIGDVEFFVRRVQVVVWQAESHHYARDLQVLLEIRDDRDRSPRADKDGLFVEDIFHRRRRSLHILVVSI